MTTDRDTELERAREIFALFIAEEDEFGTWAKNILAGYADKHPAMLKLVAEFESQASLIREAVGALDELYVAVRQVAEVETGMEDWTALEKAAGKASATLSQLKGKLL